MDSIDYGPMQIPPVDYKDPDPWLSEITIELAEELGVFPSLSPVDPTIMHVEGPRGYDTSATVSFQRKELGYVEGDRAEQ